MSVSAVAKALGLSWGTVNSLALSMAWNVVPSQPGHLDGPGSSAWTSTSGNMFRGQGDPSFVTVIVDLTPVIDGTGPVRLLDMVPGRSAATSLAGSPHVPQARTVMDPFQMVYLAAEKLTVCRQRVQQITLGHRGGSGGPLYGIKRVRLTRKVLRHRQAKDATRNRVHQRTSHRRRGHRTHLPVPVLELTRRQPKGVVNQMDYVYLNRGGWPHVLRRLPAGCSAISPFKVVSSTVW